MIDLQVGGAHDHVIHVLLPTVMRSHDPSMEVSQPLPDIFTSCVVHLYGFDEAEQRRLARYVIAYPL